MSARGWFLVIVVLVALDQLTKFWVETLLPLYERIEMLPFLSLYRTYNEGVAFSFFSELGAIPLIVLTVGIIAFVFWLWRGLEKDRLISAAGFALVISGAFGNLIDRVRIGKVIDMIFFHVDSIGFQFAVFNLADTFITLGAAAIILDEFLGWRAGRKTST
ncbi:MAG: signal peptidase II [Pseudomonadota bacterium]